MKLHFLPVITTVLASVACGGSGPARNIALADSTAVAGAKPNGPQVIHTADGGRMEGEMIDGVRDGLWSAYFANGSIRSRATYVNGAEEGPTEVFHPNGMTYYTGHYKGGKPVGEWTFFDPGGQEVQRVRYDSLGVLLK